MSSRPDLLPALLIQELEKLQDEVNPFPTKEAQKILEEDLGKPLVEITASFSEEPIASASIAQVYKARLKNGDEVAFKVQRPRIKQTVATDIDILYQLADLAEKRFERARSLRVTRIVEDFERIIGKELDFTVEASHIERFRKDFQNDTRLYIPAVYRELTTKRVLTTEFIHGIKVSDITALKNADIDIKEIAARGAGLMLSQIFNHGFFHADPHPGNLLVRNDGSLCFLDFGAIGILPPSFRYQLSIILFGFVRKDSQKVVRTLTQLTYSRIKHLEQLEYDVTEFIEEYAQTSLQEINLGAVLRHFTTIIINHDIKIVPGFYLLLRTLITVENVGSKLDPEFNLAEHLAPYVKKLIRQNSRMRHLSFDLYFAMLDLASILKDLPFELKDAMRLVKTGDLRIQFEHHGLEPMISKHDQLVNRLVFALVLASLIIGSSIVIHSGIPPLIFGMPSIGIVGFLLAGLIGFGLLFSILHKRKL